MFKVEKPPTRHIKLNSEASPNAFYEVHIDPKSLGGHTARTVTLTLCHRKVKGDRLECTHKLVMPPECYTPLLKKASQIEREVDTMKEAMDDYLNYEKKNVVSPPLPPNLARHIRNVERSLTIAECQGGGALGPIAVCFLLNLKLFFILPAMFFFIFVFSLQACPVGIHVLIVLET